MRKLITTLIIALTLLTVSCEVEVKNSPTKSEYKETKVNLVPDDEQDIEGMGRHTKMYIHTIDNCQYVLVVGYYSNSSVAMVHHADCNNPNHQ